MARFCPAYPTPRRNKASGLLMFLSARHSWLDALYERSYRMQMGEVRLPGLDLYMVNEPGLVRRVMVEQAEDFPKSELLGQALEPLLGESIFTTSGEQWRRQRAMMDPAFAQARNNAAGAMLETCSGRCTSLLRAVSRMDLPQRFSGAVMLAIGATCTTSTNQVKVAHSAAARSVSLSAITWRARA